MTHQIENIQENIKFDKNLVSTLVLISFLVAFIFQNFFSGLTDKHSIINIED